MRRLAFVILNGVKNLDEVIGRIAIIPAEAGIQKGHMAVCVGGEVMIEAQRIPYARLSGGVARGGRLYFIPPVELPLLRGRLGGDDGGGFDGE